MRKKCENNLKMEVITGKKCDSKNKNYINVYNKMLFKQNKVRNKN